MEKDWRKVFQKELCEHGIELERDSDGKKIKGLITTPKFSKCSETELFKEGDSIAYVDADSEAPVGSIITSPDGQKLTVVSNKPESQSGISPIFRTLILKKHSEIEESKKGK